MKEFENINDVLDFAINAEQDAVEFYSKLASSSKNNEMKAAFEEFAREEMKHKALLIKVKDDGVFDLKVSNIQDLKIADYYTPVKSSSVMNYSDALLLAIQKEKAAYKLYTKLAERIQSSELNAVFTGLAQEEMKHKAKFEIEYDEFVLREN